MSTDSKDITKGNARRIHKVYVTDRFMLIFGENLNTEYHSHHALQISLSLEGGMKIKCEDHIHSGNLVIVNSNHKHSINQSGVSLLLLIDSEQIEAHEIRCSKNLKDCYAESLEDNKLNEIAKKLYKENADENYVYSFYYRMIESISDSVHDHNHNIDERIEEAISIVKSDVTKAYSPEYLADEVHLSLSRFQHLFKDETGTTLSKFLLWQRTLKAIFLIVQGLSFTDAAVEAGFSDGAHFSRLVKRNFGLTMSEIKKNKEIEVIFIE